MITFQIPFLGGFLTGKAKLISSNDRTSTIEVHEGFMAGQQTDISNRYIVKS